MKKEDPNDWCAIDRSNNVLIDRDARLTALHIRMKGRKEVRYVKCKDRPASNLLG